MPVKPRPWTLAEDATLAQGCVLREAPAPFDLGPWLEVMGLDRTPHAIRQRIYRRGLDVSAPVRAALQRAGDERLAPLPSDDPCAALADIALAVSNDRRLRELDRVYIALSIVTIAEYLKSKLPAPEGPEPGETP